jgi:hypothetical protein
MTARNRPETNEKKEANRLRKLHRFFCFFFASLRLSSRLIFITGKNFVSPFASLQAPSFSLYLPHDIWGAVIHLNIYEQYWQSMFGMEFLLQSP